MAQMEEIAGQLDHALKSGTLPPDGHATGKRLLTQLGHATRIAVIGLPEAGKTALINMLVGTTLLPKLAGPAAVELRFGPTASARIDLADQTSRLVAGVVDAQSLPNGAVRVVQDLPDHRLKSCSFVKVTLSGSGTDQAALLGWAAKRADIAIWCSQQFDDRERALWSRVPDHLKDHSFLVLTRADQLYMRGELAGRIARLQPVVADEFLGLYPVASLQGLAARREDAARPQPLWQSSGGKAIFDGIEQQVQAARAADLDHASMLLERYKTAIPAAVREAPAPSLPQADAETLIDQALAILQTCADEVLAQSVTSPGDEAILDRCGRAATDLAALFEGMADLPASLDMIRDSAVEGEEMLMLLRLERGEAAETDGLTVLLQLKREIAERVGT